MIPPNQQIDAADRGTIELGSGAIIDLNQGEKVEFADPKHPNTGFDAFSAAIIKQIAAALEIPSEVLMKQFTTSYSAARGAPAICKEAGLWTTSASLSMKNG